MILAFKVPNILLWLFVAQLAIVVEPKGDVARVRNPFVRHASKRKRSAHGLRVEERSEQEGKWRQTSALLVKQRPWAYTALLQRSRCLPVHSHIPPKFNTRRTQTTVRHLKSTMYHLFYRHLLTGYD